MTCCPGYKDLQTREGFTAMKLDSCHKDGRRLVFKVKFPDGLSCSCHHQNLAEHRQKSPHWKFYWGVKMIVLGALFLVEPQQNTNLVSNSSRPHPYPLWSACLRKLKTAPKFTILANIWTEGCCLPILWEDGLPTLVTASRHFRLVSHLPWLNLCPVSLPWPHWTHAWTPLYAFIFPFKVIIHLWTKGGWVQFTLDSFLLQ